MRTHTYFTYILTNRQNGTLYTGVTNDLIRRVTEHRDGRADGFTRRYGLRHLVWFEPHTDIREAILREKRIKKWNRAWKVEMIEAANPGWEDLWLVMTRRRGSLSIRRPNSRCSPLPQSRKIWSCPTTAASVPRIDSNTDSATIRAGKLGAESW